MAGFVKFDGIDGESTDAQHEDWVRFEALDWGVAKPGASSGQSRRRGSVVVDDLVLVIEYERAAPQLLDRCLQGRALATTEIELTSTFAGGRETYLRYELSNVMVSSYRISASGDDDAGPPTVSLSISFEEIKVTYTRFDAQGAELEQVETTYERERQIAADKKMRDTKDKKKSKKKSKK